MDIYVGNLSLEVTAKDLRKVFERFGKVANATIILGRETGKSRGFGFVEMFNKRKPILQSESSMARSLGAGYLLLIELALG